MSERKLNRREKLVLELAVSIESIAEMADGNGSDALMRLRVIREDAQRIQRLINLPVRSRP